MKWGKGGGKKERTLLSWRKFGLEPGINTHEADHRGEKKKSWWRCTPNQNPMTGLLLVRPLCSTFLCSWSTKPWLVNASVYPYVACSALVFEESCFPSLWLPGSHRIMMPVIEETPGRTESVLLFACGLWTYQICFRVLCRGRSSSCLSVVHPFPNMYACQLAGEDSDWTKRGGWKRKPARESKQQQQQLQYDVRTGYAHTDTHVICILTSVGGRESVFSLQQASPSHRLLYLSLSRSLSLALFMPCLPVLSVWSSATLEH